MTPGKQKITVPSTLHIESGWSDLYSGCMGWACFRKKNRYKFTEVGLVHIYLKFSPTYRVKIIFFNLCEEIFIFKDFLRIFNGRFLMQSIMNKTCLFNPRVQREKTTGLFGTKVSISALRRLNNLHKKLAIIGYILWIYLPTFYMLLYTDNWHIV